MQDAAWTAALGRRPLHPLLPQPPLLPLSQGVLMGRGSQAQTQQLTDQQLAGINALNQQFLGQQQQIGNLLVPQFQNILNNPGLSPADKAAITGQSQGALASAFDLLQQAAANRTCRTLT